MRLLEVQFENPAENLACDEALLDWCESSDAGDVLRFWEPGHFFVVAGYSNRISSGVNTAACEANEIPIHRRCTGGGTVLQGPGCLNYSLILKIAARAELQTIHSANRFIMEKNRAALQKICVAGAEVLVQGHTDLTVATGGLPPDARRKFSGNAQRRKKNYLLFHGTLLLAFDLERIENFLLMPSAQPAYRQNRTHRDFLTNLNLPPSLVRKVLGATWNASGTLAFDPVRDLWLRLRDKYVSPEWNYKF